MGKQRLTIQSPGIYEPALDSYASDIIIEDDHIKCRFSDEQKRAVAYLRACKAGLIKSYFEDNVPGNHRLGVLVDTFA